MLTLNIICLRVQMAMLGGNAACLGHGSVWNWPEIYLFHYLVWNTFFTNTSFLLFWLNGERESLSQIGSHRYPTCVCVCVCVQIYIRYIPQHLRYYSFSMYHSIILGH